MSNGITIPAKDISVVIQGSLLRGKREGIERCLGSLAMVLPEAEIIISTWENEDICLIPSYVKVVTSKDPGCFWETPYRAYNLNRQIVSTLAGIKAATRPYCLKLRSDHALLNTNFLRVSASRPGTLFSAPLTITNLYVRNPEKYPLIFHVSDVVQFGATQDLSQYWDSELFDENDVLHPLDQRNLFQQLFSTRFKLVPEQAATLRWLSSKHNIVVKLNKVNDINPSLLKLWAEILTTNFTLINWQESGVIFPEKFENDPSVLNTLINSEDIPRVVIHGFNSAKAKRNNWIGTSFLIHGRLGPFVMWLHYNFPRTHLVLRKLWLFILKGTSKNARPPCRPIKSGPG